MDIQNFPKFSKFSFETAVGVHGFSVFFSWQFLIDKTAATAVGRYFLNSTFPNCLGHWKFRGGYWIFRVAALGRLIQRIGISKWSGVRCQERLDFSLLNTDT